MDSDLKPARNLKVGLVGLGAIGTVVSKALCDASTLPNASLAAVLVQRPREARPSDIGSTALLTTDVEAFFAADWSLCVEGAGQPWLVEFGRRVLASGRSLLVTSVGAFTDDALYTDLCEVAAKSGSQLLLAAGAMPGMDWMSSASLDDVAKVTVEQCKHPEGWVGTPAEAVLDLSAVREPTVFFEGTAREAASQYPKNANISATLALATVGLDHLKVKLVADPTVSGPCQRISMQGACGEITIEVKGKPAAGSQRTSRVVPLSVVKAIRNLSSHLVIGI